MNKAIECIRCHAQMECGYVVDLTYGGYAQQKWYPGAPESSIWKGLKLNRNQSVPVTTFRCSSCGYLESYAKSTLNG